MIVYCETKGLSLYGIKGPFINKIPRVGGGGVYFCYTLYEDVGKITI